MSIRLRFTLLYNAILALTLLIFGVGLYFVQVGNTFDALKKDLFRTSSAISDVLQRSPTDPAAALKQPEPPPPPKPFDTFSHDESFKKLPEREMVRILDAAGNLVASPFGRTDDQLPLSSDGLSTLQNRQDWWEKAVFQDQQVLIYSHPVVVDGAVTYIVQVARSLTENERSLQFLSTTLVVASLLTILIAFGVGWFFSGFILDPVRRITQTARAIGDERDFAHRVEYKGPQDEVGQLATTFNSMLARLQDAYQKVEHSLEVQRDFVADVSHELRTPLTTLRGNLGLLGRIPPIPQEEQADILADMTDESDRLIRLVNDLLVLARADAGRSLARESFSVELALDETIRQARQLDPQREISLIVDEHKQADGGAGLFVMGDRDALKQVLLIALDNALKHSTGLIQVRVARKGALVEICVQDQGEGIAPDKLEHIFDRFYRGEEAITIPGFGLGLPIAKSLMIAMGGEIEMRSQPGRGSSLALSLQVG